MEYQSRGQRIMDTQHTVIFSGEAEYVPVIHNNEVVWYRDETGNPFAAWHVESAAQVRLIATLVRQEAFEEREQPQ
jgi:hypothetical protein